MSESYASEEAQLQALDRAVQHEVSRTSLDLVVECIEPRLIDEPQLTMVWEPVPLAVYGASLPDSIRSSWVFILRAKVATGAERHPNSCQRMMSYRGSGDLQTRMDGPWEPHCLVSEPQAPISRRWISVPENVWHQAVTGSENWVVVSFHAVAAEELIEERPGMANPHLTRQRRYVDPDR